jgi:hypothetical protein
MMRRLGYAGQRRHIPNYHCRSPRPTAKGSRQAKNLLRVMNALSSILGRTSDWETRNYYAY